VTRRTLPLTVLFLLGTSVMAEGTPKTLIDFAGPTP
jgi:hypothetical protein